MNKLTAQGLSRMGFVPSSDGPTIWFKTFENGNSMQLFRSSEADGWTVTVRNTELGTIFVFPLPAETEEDLRTIAVFMTRIPF